MTHIHTTTELVSDEQPNMPPVPPGIWISLATAVLGVLGALGLPISEELTKSLIELVGALAVAIPFAEMLLRRSRLQYLASVRQPTIVLNTPPPEDPTA